MQGDAGARAPPHAEEPNDLADSYAALGRDGQALKLREETLALRQAKLGPEHPLTLRSMSNLATSYARWAGTARRQSSGRRRWLDARRHWAPTTPTPW